MPNILQTELEEMKINSVKDINDVLTLKLFFQQFNQYETIQQQGCLVAKEIEKPVYLSTDTSVSEEPVEIFETWMYSKS